MKRRWTSADAKFRPESQHGYRFQDGKVGTSFESEARLRLHLSSKPRNAARGETMGYARAFCRAVDSQPRWRLHSAVSCRHREDAIQPLDLSNALFGVHPSEYPT